MSWLLIDSVWVYEPSRYWKLPAWLDPSSLHSLAASRITSETTFEASPHLQVPSSTWFHWSNTQWYCSNPSDWPPPAKVWAKLMTDAAWRETRGGRHHQCSSWMEQLLREFEDNVGLGSVQRPWSMGLTNGLDPQTERCASVSKAIIFCLQIFVCKNQHGFLPHKQKPAQSLLPRWFSYGESFLVRRFF